MYYKTNLFVAIAATNILFISALSANDVVLKGWTPHQSEHTTRHEDEIGKPRSLMIHDSDWRPTPIRVNEDHNNSQNKW